MVFRQTGGQTLKGCRTRGHWRSRPRGWPRWRGTLRRCSSAPGARPRPSSPRGARRRPGRKRNALFQPSLGCNMDFARCHQCLGCFAHPAQPRESRRWRTGSQEGVCTTPLPDTEKIRRCMMRGHTRWACFSGSALEGRWSPSVIFISAGRGRDMTPAHRSFLSKRHAGGAFQR